MRRPLLLAGAALLLIAAAWWLTKPEDTSKKGAGSLAASDAPKGGDRGRPEAEPAAKSDRAAAGGAQAAGDEARAAKSAEVPKAPLATGAVVVKGKWGGKPGEFGRRRDEEANPEAPMAITARGKELLVVDQVNHRVQRFDQDGKPLGQIPISETVQDLAVQSGGRTVALDRLADKNIQVYDAAGKLVNEAPILGKGLEEGGAATGVFADDEGIWVEREHGALVRVADPNGNADSERTELPGRPTLDGKVVVSAAIVDRAAGKLALTAFERATLAVRWAETLTFRMPILHVITVESDARGNVYVAADLGREAPTEPFQIVEEVISIVKLDGSGQVAGALELPASATGDETTRPITVGDDGTIYRMVPSNDGMTIERYAVP